jgi:hypothetical protein
MTGQPGNRQEARYAMSKLKRLGTATSLVSEPGPRRVYGLSLLIDSFGFGLILPAIRASTRAIRGPYRAVPG